MKLFPSIMAICMLIFGSIMAAGPASALTLNQARAQAGCAGPVCTATTIGERIEVIPGAAIFSGATQGKDPSTFSNDSCFGTFGSAITVGGELWCIPGSSVGSASGGPQLLGYQPDTSLTIGTQTTVTKELVRVGAAAPGNGPWDVVTTTETVDIP